MPIGEVTEGWDEDVGYLERVTVINQALAEEKFCEAWTVEPDDIDVEAIFLRHVTEDPEPIVVPDIPCWLECDADHPDAVPFWRVKA